MSYFVKDNYFKCVLFFVVLKFLVYEEAVIIY